MDLEYNCIIFLNIFYREKDTMAHLSCSPIYFPIRLYYLCCRLSPIHHYDTRSTHFSSLFFLQDGGTLVIICGGGKVHGWRLPLVILWVVSLSATIMQKIVSICHSLLNKKLKFLNIGINSGKNLIITLNVCFKKDFF